MLKRQSSTHRVLAATRGNHGQSIAFAAARAGLARLGDGGLQRSGAAAGEGDMPACAQQGERGGAMDPRGLLQ